MEVTNLSAGLLIREILLNSDEVKAITSEVFPVVTYDATLPYVSYRRTSLSAVANSGNNADTVVVEVNAWGERYEDAVALAEAIRSALDGYRGAGHGLVIRHCYLTDSEEGWEADAFRILMLFTIKIN